MGGPLSPLILAANLGSSLSLSLALPPSSNNSAIPSLLGRPYCTTRSNPSKVTNGLLAKVTISCARCSASSGVRKSEMRRMAAEERRSNCEMMEIR